jgi:hypothetical protein
LPHSSTSENIFGNFSPFLTKLATFSQNIGGQKILLQVFTLSFYFTKQKKILKKFDLVTARVILVSPFSPFFENSYFWS